LEIACLPDGVELGVVLLPVLLEIQAAIQERLTQRAIVAEQQRDQQSADAAVAIEEWMYSFKLKMREGCFEQGRSIRVKEPLQITHAVVDFLWRRWHESRIS